MITIGILALQGGYHAHARMLEQMNVPWLYLREPEALTQVQGLIIPGGESSTCLKLLEQSRFFEALQTAGHNGMPMFGTCAGAILLAKEVLSPTQPCLGLMDIAIERNAYGRQLSSRIAKGIYIPENDAMEMVFIRAPRMIRYGAQTQVLATCEQDVVCVADRQYLAATFHPELSQDTRLHRYFVDKVVQNRQN